MTQAIQAAVAKRCPSAPRALLLGLLAALPGPAEATILLFDEARDAATQSIVVPTTSGAALPADYGDNVTGAAMAVPGGSFSYGDGGEGFTPDVTVDIFTAAGPTERHVDLWATGYGDLVNAAFGEGPGVGGSPMLSVLLSAAPGYVVDLYGFDLGGWNNTDYAIAGVDVFGDGVTLFSEADVLVQGDFSGARHTSFGFAEPLSASEILVQLDLSNLASGIQDNIGIDSIRFGQTPPGVPESAAPALLMLAGLVSAGVRRARAEQRV